MRLNRVATVFLVLLLVSAFLQWRLNFVPSVKATTETFTLTNDPDDGDALNEGADYQTTHDAAVGSDYGTTSTWFGQEYVSETYKIYRALLKFDTSSIPDGATITEAKLCVYGDFDYSDVDFTVRIQNWTEASDGISKDDYDAFDEINYDDGNFNTADFSTSAYNNITISNFSIINKLGYTAFCVRSEEDVGSGSAPTGKEFVTIDDAGSTKKPKLEVTYTAGSQVTLNSPSDNANIGNTSKIDFKYTPIFLTGETIQNASLYTNQSGSWVLTQSNTTVVVNNTENTITYTFSSDGVYIWNVGVWNSTQEIFADANYTLTIESEYNLVDNNTSDVDSSADKGTHSDFTNEQVP